MANFRRKRPWRHPKTMSLSSSHIRRFGNTGGNWGERFRIGDMRRLQAANQQQRDEHRN